MKLNVPPGNYVVAVSGGVDSMVLLDLLIKQPGLNLTVAHFDHGIRDDSAQDRQLVQQVARAHGVSFVYDRANLGTGVSEAVAREARYKFLHAVREASLAQAIITAHHQDDRLETAVINMLRGTGRRGLSSLKSRDLLVRPLLAYDKKTLRDYAQHHQLAWREDSTNADEKYLRNYVRHRILPRFSEEQRQQLIVHLNTATELNHELEELLTNQLHIRPIKHQVDRPWFIGLPHIVAREVMATWLREQGVVFDSKTLERLIVAAKTYAPRKQVDISGQAVLRVSQAHLALGHRDR